jgi:hypothetical protein
MLSDLDKDVETAAKELAGNWQKFESFGWYSDARPDNAEQWAIVNLSHRDSGCLDQSNEATILKELAPFMGWHKDGATVETQRHGHWAVGHVNALVIRCVGDSGAPTEAFKVLHGLAMALADYPILDESDFSEREYEEENEAWDNFGASDFRSELVKLAPHHYSLFDRVPGDHLWEVWAAICTNGETCIHEDSGCYFPFDSHFGRRAGACALSWEDVRGVFLKVKADRVSRKLAATG